MTPSSMVSAVKMTLIPRQLVPATPGTEIPGAVSSMPIRTNPTISRIILKSVHLINLLASYPPPLYFILLSYVF